MFAISSVMDFTHLHISVLQLDPPQAIFDFHLDGSILYIF
jgi:hypothetical protein